MTMRIALVAAIAENNAFGLNGAMPWKLKGELAYFKAITMGHAVIMGRKTFDSLPFRPLKGRYNIVISRSPTPIKGAIVCNSLEDALNAAKTWDYKEAEPKNIAMVIGGAEILHLALPKADFFYRTLVRCQPKADVYFDGFCANEWQKKSTIVDQETNSKTIGYVMEKWIKNDRRSID